MADYESILNYAEKYNMPLDTSLNVDWWQKMADKAYQQGRADGIDEYNKKIDYLKNCYVDACNMCTRMGCDVCAISNFIEHLEQLKEQR